MSDKEDYKEMQKSFYNSAGMSNHLEHDKNPDLHRILLAPADGDTVLDFGCGKGRNILNLLTDFTWNKVWGADISIENLKAADTYTNSKATTFFETRGDDLGDIPLDSVDLIISTICLQHICCYDIRYDILTRMFETLKVGGALRFQMGFGTAHPKTVEYFDNDFAAGGTNGMLDVRVTDPKAIMFDLEMIGFRLAGYQIKPSFSDRHKEWIYVEAIK